MTCSVLLPYTDYGETCAFSVYIGREADTGHYVHEFRPDPPMAAWLAEQAPDAWYRTVVTGEGDMACFTHLEVFFPTEAQALLFKLTWA